MGIQQMIKDILPVDPTAYRIIRGPDKDRKAFEGSRQYWENRYETGGTSGNGSYNQLAAFKAEILNTFVSEHKIASVAGFGCGDGNQLRLARYPNYIGFDISPKAIATCRDLFSGDGTKHFKLAQTHDGETAELALSLDVIYHLVEDDVFDGYMARLFNSAERFVIIYSSNTDDNPRGTAMHVRHRNFSKWIADNQPGWTLMQLIPNRHPFQGDTKSGSFSDFYIYAKR